MSAVEVVSIVASIVSVVLAAFAIWQATDSRREAQQSHEKTKDLLSQIDKRSAVTEERVAENFQKILDAVLDSFRRNRSDHAVTQARERGPSLSDLRGSQAPKLLQAMESAFNNALAEIEPEGNDDFGEGGEENNETELEVDGD